MWPRTGVVAPLWLRAKSAYGGGRGMFEHEVSQALPVQAREAEEVPRSQLAEYNEGLRRRGDLTVWFDEEAIAKRYCQELWIPFLIQAALLFKFSSIPSTNFPPCIRRATSPGALTRRHRRLAMSSSL